MIFPLPADRTKHLFFLWLPLVLCSACATAGGYDQLPATERTQFAQCWDTVVRRHCGPPNLYQSECTTEHRARYAAAENRATYLSALGCGVAEAPSEGPESVTEEAVPPPPAPAPSSSPYAETPLTDFAQTMTSFILATARGEATGEPPIRLQAPLIVAGPDDVSLDDARPVAFGLVDAGLRSGASEAGITMSLFLDSVGLRAGRLRPSPPSGASTEATSLPGLHATLRSLAREIARNETGLWTCTAEDAARYPGTLLEEQLREAARVTPQELTASAAAASQLESSEVRVFPGHPALFVQTAEHGLVGLYLLIVENAGDIVLAPSLRVVRATRPPPEPPAQGAPNGPEPDGE